MLKRLGRLLLLMGVAAIAVAALAPQQLERLWQPAGGSAEQAPANPAERPAVDATAVAGPQLDKPQEGRPPAADSPHAAAPAADLADVAAAPTGAEPPPEVNRPDDDLAEPMPPLETLLAETQPEAGEAEVAEAEVAESETAQAEAPEAEAAKAEAAKAEAAEAEVAEAEAAEAEAAEAEAAEAEVAEAEVAEAEAGEVDAALNADEPLYSPGTVHHQWPPAVDSRPTLAEAAGSAGEERPVRLPALEENSPAAAPDASSGAAATPLVTDFPEFAESPRAATSPPAAGAPSTALPLDAPPAGSAVNGSGGSSAAPTYAPDLSASPSAAPGRNALSEPPPAANLVTFGRGLVELRVPDDWFVTEAAAGRDVRLVLSSGEYRQSLEEGMWITCHLLEQPQAVDLAQLLPERIAAVTRSRGKSSGARTMRIGGWEGLRGDFQMEIQPLSVRGQPEPRRYRGFHALVPTPWALLEIHALTPTDNLSDDAGEGGRQLEAMLQSMQLQAPQPRKFEPLPTTIDAEGALGVWKSSRGRFRLLGNGQVDVEMDRLLLLSTPASRQEAERLEAAGPARLRGAFRAAGDVIFITWNDGSRLNLRWKISNGNLLLTDHDGQISKLKPLLE